MKLFERLERKYLDDLAARAMSGDSDAFAELFAATADRQLYYLSQLYGDREEALDTLGKVYTDVMKQFASLGDPGSFLPWVSRLSANAYLEAEGRVNTEHGQYSLTQILNLPLTEAQITLMQTDQLLSEAEICGILNMSRTSVRSFRKNAARRLGSGPAKRAGKTEETARKRIRTAPLTPAETSEILDRVFEECSRPHNTTPVEDLSSYAVYRKERFTVQRVILAVGLVLFMLLPLCFVLPEFVIAEGGSGNRGLPVYDVNVKSFLPVGKVLATIREIELPVYEGGAKEFTIEPTGNGSMIVSVELINRQKTQQRVKVDSVDSEAPHILGSKGGKDTITLTAEDNGIGVDYHGIYAETGSGEKILPLSADEETGIVFVYPKEDWDIYIPDHLGNTLHLSLKLD